MPTHLSWANMNQDGSVTDTDLPVSAQRIIIHTGQLLKIHPPPFISIHLMLPAFCTMPIVAAPFSGAQHNIPQQGTCQPSLTQIQGISI